MTSKEVVYGAFVDFYGDISLNLIKNENGWAVYACRVHSGLGFMNRYIFAIVAAPPHITPSQSVTLNNLDWVSFQTRTTEEMYNVPTHQLFLTPAKKEVLSDKINAMERNRDSVFYVTPNLPIKVQLVKDYKRKSAEYYPDKALLYQALETFHCVVELL